MNYQYQDKFENVYMIDTHMFGFAQYMSIYLIKGKELALIDTGNPRQLEYVRAGIKAHGFSISDISYIFITHCEHPDHTGNIGVFVKENPNIKVFINPVGLEFLTHPEIEANQRKKVLPPQQAARFGVMEPVPHSCIQYLKDNDVFDLGNGERLKIFFTSGHQPSGLVILEEKNQGLFINDLVGLYLPDADLSMVLTSDRSDVPQITRSLKTYMDIPLERLFVGHFGIQANPQKVMQRTLDNMQNLMDIAAQCMKEGKPEEIEPRVYAYRIAEAEKLKTTRGKDLYDYIRLELSPHQAKVFSEFYLNLHRKQ